MERDSNEREVVAGDVTYYVVPRPMFLRDAVDYAAFFKKTLASIPDRPTNVVLADTLNEMGISAAWIGLSDSKREGKWVWLNGDESKFRSWQTGEPNNSIKHDDSGEDHCALMSNGRWTDRFKKAHKYPFIMQTPVVAFEG